MEEARAEDGTDARMAEVAEEAGVARSTVYRYFQSRDDLIIGLGDSAALTQSAVGAIGLDRACRWRHWPGSAAFFPGNRARTDASKGPLA